MTEYVRVPMSRQEARLAAQSGVVAWLSGYKQEYRAPHDTLCDLIADAMLAASPQGEKESDCVCVQRGDGPEGCGLCNETGVVTHPASPQGEGLPIGQNDQPGLAFSGEGEKP